jgi:hypothetical protein
MFLLLVLFWWMRPKLMEFLMNTKLARAGIQGLPRQIRYVVVNHRMPRADPRCVLCGRDLQQGYVRDLETSRPYCDPCCLAGHATIKRRSIEYLERKAS